MNDLEKKIFYSAVRAHDTYEEMTGGWWLMHAPESFLQHEVGRAIHRKGFEVFPEASPRKIAREHDKPKRGRPAKLPRVRFDVVVWHKNQMQRRGRAVIEIKRALNNRGVLLDAKKLKSYLKNDRYGSGYLLVYSQAVGPYRRATLGKRITALKNKLKAKGWKLLNQTIRPKSAEVEDDGRVWA